MAANFKGVAIIFCSSKGRKVNRVFYSFLKLLLELLLGYRGDSICHRMLGIHLHVEGSSSDQDNNW